MRSRQALREFINDRLTAAAEEIFTVFEETIVNYEEEIRRQLKLFELTRNPEIKLHRTVPLQQHDCREECLGKPEKTHHLEQEEAELLQFKEELEEPESPQMGEESETPQTEEEQKELEKICMFPSDHVDNVRASGKLFCEETSGEIVCKQNNLCQNFGRDKSRKKKMCKICENGFTRQETLLDHMRTHTSEMSFSCQRCKKTFSSTRSLVRHISSRTCEKLYSCELCVKGFSSKKLLLRHMPTHVSKNKSCKTCLKVLSSTRSLLRHMRTHTKNKYSCGTCKKGFSSKKKLLCHMRTHRGEKPHPFETLGGSFSSEKVSLHHV